MDCPTNEMQSDLLLADGRGVRLGEVIYPEVGESREQRVDEVVLALSAQPGKTMISSLMAGPGK